MAPELFQTGHYDHKIDAFAYGQMMIEVLSGESLFNNIETFVIMNKMINYNLPPILNIIEEPIRSVIEKCRAFDPGERPEFSEIEMFLEDYVESSLVKKVLIIEARTKGLKKLAEEAYKVILKKEYLEKRIRILTKEKDGNSIFHAIQRDEGNFQSPQFSRTLFGSILTVVRNIKSVILVLVYFKKAHLSTFNKQYYHR